MRDDRKTKKQLIHELKELRKRLEGSVSVSVPPVDSEVRTSLYGLEEAQLAAVIDNIPVMTMLVDRERRISRVNRSMVKITGRTEKEMLGLRGGEAMGCLHSLDGPRMCGFAEACRTCVVRQAVLDTLESGTGCTGIETELTIDIHGKLSRRNLLISTAPLVIGGTDQVLVCILDLTEHKAAENALYEREAVYSAIAAQAYDGISLIDSETLRFVEFNDSACRGLGYSREEFGRLSLCDIQTFLSPEEVLRRVREILRRGYLNFENEQRLKDGTSRYVRVSNRVVRIHGRPYIAAIWHDMTDTRRTEESLRENRARLDLILKSTNMGVWQWNIAKDERLFDDETCRLLGIDPVQFVGSDEEFFARVHPEDRDQVRLKLDASREYDLLYEPEFRAVWDDGSIHHLTSRGKVIRDNSGEPVRISGVIWDITERKMAEEALRRSESELHKSYSIQSLRNMILSESFENISLELILQKALNMILAVPWFPIEAAGSILLVEDKPDVIVMKAWSNIDEVLCREVSFGQCLCGRAAATQDIQFADRADEHCRTCFRGGLDDRGHYAVPILFGDRTEGVLNIYLKAGEPGDAKLEDFLQSIATSLSSTIARKRVEQEKQRLHAELLQSQKMEAMGMLAGGIAHDFNNILTAIMGFAHVLKMKIQENDPLRLYPDRILTASEKAINLTQSLLAFSRKQVTNPRPVDLNDIVTDVNKLFMRVLGEDIEQKIVLADGDLTVMADSGQIEQVLINLATNARDSMPEGGLLSIETRLIEIDREFIREHGFGREGSYALVSVTDTGSGMNRETTERIFEPFFTTKEIGKGTGLGLSMAYGIVKQHDGYIDVYSEPAEGTTFRIYLPLTGVREKEEDLAPARTPERGTETILLAEDNNEVRLYTKELLSDYGYCVIEAVDGADAVIKFAEHNGRIGLLLFDVIMPKKNGKEACATIRSMAPGIKALFLSGYPEDVVQRKGILDKGHNVVIKPVSPDVLLKRVRELLDGHV